MQKPWEVESQEVLFWKGVLGLAKRSQSDQVTSLEILKLGRQIGLKSAHRLPRLKLMRITWCMQFQAVFWQLVWRLILNLLDQTTWWGTSLDIQTKCLKFSSKSTSKLQFLRESSEQRMTKTTRLKTLRKVKFCSSIFLQLRAEVLYKV